MAIKKRPTDEDDEERPRGKRRRDEDDDDDDDRSPKRRRSRDDDEDEEDEDRPAKRRRSRDEEDDDEEDEERPRKRRKAKDEEEDEEEPPAKKPAKKDEKPAKAEPDDDDAEYAAWQKKKVQTRKQYLAVQAGLAMFDKRIRVFVGCLAGVIGTMVLALFLMSLLGEVILYVVYLMIVVLGVVPPLIGMQAATKCKLGPSKINGDAYLSFEPIISVVIMAMFGLCVVCVFVSYDPAAAAAAAEAQAQAAQAQAQKAKEQKPNNPIPAPKPDTSQDETTSLMMWIGAAGAGLGYIAYMVSFINELLYLQTFAKFMKDKLQLPRAAAAIAHFIKFAFIALPIVGTAGYFLSSTSLGLLGKVMAGILAAVWLITLFKGFMDTRRIVEALGLTITKKLAAEDKPNW